MRALRALSLALLLSSSAAACAHTKPLGQTFVALGALIVAGSALDAAGALGSHCSNTPTPQGDAVHSCGGNGLVPQPVNVAGILVGAGLVGAGAYLWTTDSQTTPAQQTQTFPIARTTQASFVGQQP